MIFDLVSKETLRCELLNSVDPSFGLLLRMVAALKRPHPQSGLGQTITLAEKLPAKFSSSPIRRNPWRHLLTEPHPSLCIPTRWAALSSARIIHSSPKEPQRPLTFA